MIDNSDSKLPPDVTEEPRGPEHMDLSKVAGYHRWIRTYLPISDDEGEFLGDHALEVKVKKRCDDLKVLKIVSLRNEQDLIALKDELKDLCTEYGMSINLTDNLSRGHVTKYRIRHGTLLNHLKEVVKALGFEWTVWFRRNFDQRQFRAAQNSMKLAGIPNIIQYAVFGTERLLEIVRQIEPSCDSACNIDPPLALIGIQN